MKMKRSVALILSVLMLLSTLPTVNVFAADKTGYSRGDIVTFGYYPQILETDLDVTNALLRSELRWTSYNYQFYSNYSASVGDKMVYTDVEYDGELYRGVRFSDFRTNEKYFSTYPQEANGYERNTIYWFKYAPIEWIVIDPGEGLLLSKNVIDSQIYDLETSGASVTWVNSDIRAWLNGDFYNFAFTAEEREKIQKTTLENHNADGSAACVDTVDRVFLLSVDDICGAKYGFDYYLSPRSEILTGSPTEYAKCQGVQVSVGNEYYGACHWTLRTTDASYFAYSVCPDGEVATGRDVLSYEYRLDSSRHGTRPAMRVDLSGGRDPGPQKSPYEQGDIFEFGMYPQSPVADPDLTGALNRQKLEWKTFGFDEDMKYVDVLYGDDFYRGVVFTSERGFAVGNYSETHVKCYQKLNGYEPKTIYWFKYEPIRWLLLDPAESLAISEMSLDAQPFGNSSWANSDLRAWLNSEFLGDAFTVTEQRNIQKSTLENNDLDGAQDCVDTVDRVYLLSADELKDPKNGFEYFEYTDIPCSDFVFSAPTEYAKCMGIQYDKSQKASPWRLRTFSKIVVADRTDRTLSIDDCEHEGYILGVNSYYGIRPVLRLDTLPEKTEPPTEPEPTAAPTTAPYSVPSTTEAPATEPYSVPSTTEAPATEPYSVPSTTEAPATEPYSVPSTTEAPATEPYSVPSTTEAPATEPAQVPVIDKDINGEDAYQKGERASEIRVSASVSDGGTLSYQWYENTQAQTDGASAVNGATKPYFTPPTDEAGLTYYFVVITNTNPAAEPQSASAVSGFRKVTIAKSVTLSDLSYSFVNARSAFGYPENYCLPLEIYELVYGDEGAYRREHDGNGYWTGNCFGMTGSSLMLFVDGNDISVGDFNAASIETAQLTDKNVSLDITLHEFIQAIQITQLEPATNRCYTTNKNDLNRLCAAVEHFSLTGSDPVIVTIFGNDDEGIQRGHAVVGYRLEKIGAKETRMHIYDPNFPQTDRYITLKTDNEGNYVSWSYLANDVYPWGTGKVNSYISFIPYSYFSAVWENRGSIDDDGRLSLVSIASEDAVIYDTKSEVVARIENGAVVASAAGVQPVITVGMTADGEADGVPVNSLWIPVGEYGVENKSEGDGKLVVSMMNAGLMADVDTQARKVHLNVNGSEDLNEVRIIAEPGETYEYAIDLYSASGTVLKLSDSTAEPVVGASMVGSEFIGVGIAGLSSSGTPVPTYTVSYDANGGDGVPYSQTKIDGLTLKLAGKTPYRTGYTFLGWATAPDADSAGYAPGAEYADDRTVTLFAVWQEGEREPETTEPLTTEEPVSAPSTTEPPTTERPVSEPPTTEPVSEPPQVKGYLGDADLDGKVKAGDARLILRHAARLSVLTDPTAKLLADIDGDGKISAGDARSALRMASRLDPLVEYGAPSDGPADSFSEEEKARAVSLRRGGTVIGWIPEEELESVGWINDEEADRVRVLYDRGDRTDTHFFAVSPLSDTPLNRIVVFDADDPDNINKEKTIVFTADDGGASEYLNSKNVPDFGALFGVAPELFSVIETESGSRSYLFGYALGAPAFGGRSESKLIDEYCSALEKHGFSYADVTTGEDGVEYIRYESEKEFVLFSVYDDDGFGRVLALAF